MHWAETTEILGRDEDFQTGTPHFFTRGGGQQVHEYGKEGKKFMNIEDSVEIKAEGN